MEESEKSYEEFSNFGEFFNRKLKPGIRPISHAPIVSPADGLIVHYGEIKEGDKIVYVKGQDFDLDEFLGPCKVHLQSHMKLYQICIYLTPGSYHSFHSPAKWTMKEIYHHPGDLFKVRPGFINFIPRIFCVNERVAMCGIWEHGFMSITPIAATFVGDIVIDVEDPSHPILADGKQTVPYNHVKVDHSLKAGEKLGEFRNGSVNVLIFEGPPDLKFCIKPGQSVNYGMPLVH
uniref:phosphatidylserine decarboxylase n=1 Tax=Panagrolaimus superbus TaxID=310955 RepID=A0A914YR75_9BILA